jgi:peptidoglycan/xylan/chitin deacetylase (PgdA/CDA1 family)
VAVHAATVAWQAARRVKRTVEDGVARAGNALVSPPRTCAGRVANHAGRDRPAVALTFDDGPSAVNTGPLLDLLARLEASVTFFFLGEQVARRPDLVRRAHDEGHQVAIHGWDHARWPALVPGAGTAHVDRAADAVQAAIGVRPRCYRAPWGWVTPWEARRLGRAGYRLVGWDVDPEDWRFPEPPAKEIADRVMDGVRPGSIIVMHDGRCSERYGASEALTAAVVAIAAGLRGRGLALVTLADLLGTPAYRPESPARQGDGPDGPFPLRGSLSSVNAAVSSPPS